MLETELLAAALRPRRSVLVGDLNARSEDLGCGSSNTNGTVLSSFVEASGSVVLNDPSVPTFHHNSYGFSDCLDWALASPAAAASLSCSLGLDVGSDHLPLVLQRPPSRAPVPGPAPLPRWRTNGLGWTERFAASLERELTARQLTSAPVPASPREVDLLAAEVADAVTTSADSCLRRSRHRSETGALPLPWWLRVLVRARRQLRRRLGHSPEEDATLRPQLSALRTAIRRGVQQHQRERAQQKTAVFARGPRDASFWPAVRGWFRGPHLSRHRSAAPTNHLPAPPRRGPTPSRAT